MLRVTRSITKSEIRLKHASIRLPVVSFSSATETRQTGSQPPPPPEKRGGIFWKLLGLTFAGAGGVVGYAWYDASFKKTVEDNIPYSQDVLSAIFQYLPVSTQANETTASSDKLIRPIVPAIQQAEVPQAKKEIQPAEVSIKQAQPVAVPAESKKEKAAREAREKKEKAQELLRQREAQETAENQALETGLETLSKDVLLAVEQAVAAHETAAKTMRTHSEQLKSAMEKGSTEAQWETLTSNQQGLAESLVSSEQAAANAREILDKLTQAVTVGRANAITKRNKVLSITEKEIKRLNKELSSATAELAKARSEAKKLSEYRDLVWFGKEQLKKELLESGKDTSKTSEGGQAATDLNSLIAHAHKKIDQLQRQLIEKQALESVRIQAALDAAKEEDEKQANVLVAEERRKANVELENLRQRWEAEALSEFDVELRQQLARQTAAHSDHLVEALHSQRAQLLADFEKQMTERVEVEKYRLQAAVTGSLSRMKAIESAIEGRAEKERTGFRSRELWLACRALLSVIKEGHQSALGSDEPLRICAELEAIRDAGSEHPIVHVALSSVPELVHRRGIYTSEALAERFARVKNVTRRVAMIDESNGSLSRYLLSYVQSFFVMRTKPYRDDSDIDVSDLSTFDLLDNADDRLRRGDLEQAVRFVNALQGESRRVASGWLDEARVLLETRQAAELLLAFATANGLGSIDQ